MTPEIKAYLVGGAVRDKLLGVPTKDFDYTVVAPSYAAMVEWIQHHGKIFLEQEQYWTVRAKLTDGQPADYVLARKDGSYSDGRRPDSVSVGSLFDDLSRRDFTANAIAYDAETDTYIDPFGGKEAIEKKALRCVGKTEDRFHEDALRMLRAIRFAITKGFSMSASIQRALHDPELLKKLRDTVSIERKREELTRCFSHDTVTTLHYLHEYEGITEACFQGSPLWLIPTLKERVL